MATQDLEKLIVKLDADLRSYERALAKSQGLTTSSMRKIERDVQSSANRVETSFARMGSSAARFGKGLLAGVGITGLAALGNVIQETIAQAAKIGDVADKIGLTTEQLQALQLGAVQANLSFEDLDKGLSKFSKTLGEAANGQGEYLKTLRANNVELKGTFFDNLKQLASLIKNAANEQDQMLLATQAMGKGGGDFLEFLKNGGTGLDAFIAQLERSGSKIDDALIRKAQVIDDSWAAMWNSITNKSKSAVLTIVSDLDVAAQQAKGFFERISEAIEPADWRKILPTGALPKTSSGAGFLDQQAQTKISNPEVEAEKKRLAAEKAAAAKRKEAEAAREAKRAEEELTRAIEQQFEAFTRSLTAIDDDIAALKLEAATLGLTTFEIERQRVAQELLNEANRAGVTVTADVNAVIQAKAKAYGQAAQAAEELRRKQEEIDEINSSLQESLSSFITDLAHGVEPVEAFTSALKNLADQLVQVALNSALTGLFDSKQGGGIGGAIAALVSHKGGTVGQGGGHRAVSPGVFAGARRMHRGGLAGDEVPTILQKGEIVLPKGFKSGGGAGGYGRVVVNNYGGHVEQRETRGPGGERQLSLWFKANFHKEFASQSTQKSLQAGYGLQPLMKRR